MKKIIAMVMLVVMTAGTGIIHASDRKGSVDSTAILKVVRKYQGKEGFETVTFGNLAVGLVKLVANAAAQTPEDKAALDIMDGISKFVAVEYYDAEASVKASFNKEISALLAGAEKIVEVKDDGDSVDIYGTLSKDGEKIRDIIIHVPEESSIVCIFGTVDIKDLGEVMKTANE
jgi:hypothetical protein